MRATSDGYITATTDKEKTNGARTIPQIFIGETYVGGYEELKALDNKGELDSLLGI